MPDNMVIVLDPGHGGENEGLTYNGFVEKDMNLVTANAMRDELLQYDNVEVYITNPDEIDMSLKERAQYAQSVGADIVISLHFNMSENHQMYGSEVWIPSLGRGNAKMHSLGDILLEEFSEMGLTVRGVKTRLNDEGKDYYGIIRESADLSIPCILVEHGYADHKMDYDFLDTEEDWKMLGRSDAKAVAKYYGLSSASLGNDYSDYVKNGYFAPEQAIGSDKTAPEQATIIWNGTEDNIQIYTIYAKDAESKIVYYDYSLDGGQTWSEVLPFQKDSNNTIVKIADVKPGSQVCARVYNGYFLYTQTNTISYQMSEIKTDLNNEELNEAKNTQSGKDTLFTGTKVPGTEYARQSAYRGTRNLLIGSSIGLFIAFLLIFTAFLTYKERLHLRYTRRRIGIPLHKLRRLENCCFLCGVAVLLISLTGMGVSVARKVDIKHHIEEAAEMDETEYTGSVSDQTNSGNLSSDLSDHLQSENIQSNEPLVMISEAVSMNDISSIYNVDKKETATIYDIAEGYLRVPMVETMARNPYQLNAFSGKDLQKKYSTEGQQAAVGIDVSKFQGNIDWKSVKDAGVQFAILRLGLRGYGTGELHVDDKFYDNLNGARAEGIKTGVYFFSAAINEDEAVEEANYVLHAIEGYGMEMPIVFDTEPIYYDDARTDDLTPNQLTGITKAFCNTIKAAGYNPMIYANAKRFTTVLHLEELTDYDMWLADYRDVPDYPYNFKMWQFTEKGEVPGIEGHVDIDLFFYEE